MKTMLAVLATLLVLALPAPAQAQAKHEILAVAFGQTAGAPSATLTWTQPTGVPAGTTVNLFRCAGTPCTALTSFTQLVTGLAAGGPYVDTTVTAGAYSYYAVNVNGAQTSAASNIASATLPLPAPTGLTATAN